MARTATYQIPYPAPGEAPDGPAQIQALAEAADTELARLQARIGAYGAHATSNLTLTATRQDIAGTTASITTTRPNAVAVINAVWDFSITSGSDNSSHDIGVITVDGVEQSAQGLIRCTANNRGTVAQTYVVPLAAAGSHPVKLRAFTGGSGITTTCNSPHTGWSAFVIDGA